MPDQPSPLRPGLLILHGNRLEWLAQAVGDWLASHPLAPLETETVLVQSNGMGEWLKMQLATRHGVCAATSVELPARFLWRAYRAVLGSQAVPALSPLDERPLIWRLMGMLPGLSREPGFEPLRAFLGADDADAARRLQLAQRLADLFDQYQVHRSDWLLDWAQGRDVLRTGLAGRGEAVPVPPPQAWQPALWRRLQLPLSPEEQQAARPAVHRRFLQALREPAAEGEAQRFPKLPRRVVLFGTTHVPLQALEAVAALAGHSQVLMAVPNPCRHHWADTLDGRDLLRMQRRRQGLRNGVDLAAVPLEQMHAHGHPLLSAWGRQSRDFVRQLDAFDDAEAARERFAVPRIDLFDDTPPTTLLEQVQAAVRDLVPLAEHPHQRLAPGGAVDPGDRSIVFHVAHSPQREVEVLHDQLLHLLAHPPGGQALAPRDIVVMVPDIDTFAPAIRSVFGQPTRGDARYIPWGIADQRDRGQHPLLLALEWLMRAPQQRFAASQVRALLEVPAAAARLGLSADDLPLLLGWIEDAGVRWGLDADQRASLGLALDEAEGGLHNTWVFGLRRMLLGYATGELPQDTYAGIEPYAEVAGLDAGLAGSLDHLLQTLLTWWRDAQQARSPADWAGRLRQLLADLFAPTDTNERALIRALDTGLEPWLQACEAAGFHDAVDLAVAREAWLGAVDEPGLTRRFRAGGVTFCTLLPMRAIPFDVVCLLGMNDGDYPRRSSRADFDLMALAGQGRPGDRSGRDDDRQLMLDAVLSARRVLHVSWSGRSPREPGERPPSVLVSQLRDYLRKGWGDAAVAARTVHHPLQPFSRRYFDPNDPLFTYAAEWRDAHADDSPQAEAAGEARDHVAEDAAEPAQRVTLGVKALADFLRNPVRAFFGHRLQVRFDAPQASAPDDEPFGSDGLERWALIDEVLDLCRRQGQAVAQDVEGSSLEGIPALTTDPMADLTADPMADPGSDPGPSPGFIDRLVTQQIDRLRRAGRLPLAGPGRREREALRQTLTPMIEHWQALLAAHPQVHEPRTLRLEHPDDPGLVFEDVLSGLRSQPDGEPGRNDFADPAGFERLERFDSSRIPERPEGPESPEAARRDEALPVWIDLVSSRVAVRRSAKAGMTARPDKVVGAWVRCLASAACGHPAEGIVVGQGTLVRLRPPAPEDARFMLFDLMAAWRDSMSDAGPWPTAMDTGLAMARGEPDKARQAYEGDERNGRLGDVREPCLARLYPDFDRLSAETGFETACQRLYAPLKRGLDAHATATAWGPLEATDADEDEETGDA